MLARWHSIAAIIPLAEVELLDIVTEKHDDAVTARGVDAMPVALRLSIAGALAGNAVVLHLAGEAE